MMTAPAVFPGAAALAVAAEGVGVAVLVARCKVRPVVRRRWAFIFVARRAQWSLVQIGRKLGGRDHSTIRSGFVKATALIDRDADFAALVARVGDAWAGAATPAPPINSGG